MANEKDKFYPIQLKGWEVIIVLDALALFGVRAGVHDRPDLESAAEKIVNSIKEQTNG